MLRATSLSTDSVYADYSNAPSAETIEVFPKLYIR